MYENNELYLAASKYEMIKQINITQNCRKFLNTHLKAGIQNIKSTEVQNRQIDKTENQ